jgi:hypothetical protein
LPTIMELSDFAKHYGISLIDFGCSLGGAR